MKIKKQIFNPYLPEDNYIPDGEPHVFDTGDGYYVSYHRMTHGTDYSRQGCAEKIS